MGLEAIPFKTGDLVEAAHDIGAKHTVKAKINGRSAYRVETKRFAREGQRLVVVAAMGSMVSLRTVDVATGKPRGEPFIATVADVKGRGT